jgi:hypothetical protein
MEYYTEQGREVPNEGPSMEDYLNAWERKRHDPDFDERDDYYDQP